MKFSDLLTKSIQGIMSEQEIRAVGDQIISEIVGPDPANLYVNALKNAVAPLLIGHLQVLESSSQSVNLFCIMLC